MMRENGTGLFLFDNYADLDFLTEAMKADCQNINDSYSFYGYVMKHNGGYFSRNEFLYWFHSMWKFIPESELYEIYKELLSDMWLYQGRAVYDFFFKPNLRKEILKLNKHDTVKNPTLNSLLDEDGYLTVYYSNYKETVRKSNSWLLDKDRAIQVGRIYAGVHKSPTFHCITGKVKLADILTFIEGHREHEVIAPQTKVINQVKEFFNTTVVEYPSW